MAKSNDALKKHHFWILVGLVPLMVLIAVIMITSSVGAEIEAKKGAVDKAKTELASKSNPKPNVLIKLVEKQKEQLEGKRTDLWKENWERQIGVSVTTDRADKEVRVQDPNRNLLRWPKSQLLDKYNYTPEYATDKSQLKFGASIPYDLGEDNEFKKPEVYIAEFTNQSKTGMVDRVAPTAFAYGNWASVLRHVDFPASGPNGWGDRKPTSEQLWLALEDIWVQRALLGTIRTVNDQIGTFAPAKRYDAAGKELPDAPLERAFASRIWYVTIKVAPRPGDNRYVLTGTLQNMTDRLQLLGTGNTMVLNVWLSKDPSARPVPFRIGGEFVAGGATIEIKASEDNVLPAGGIAPTEIARVEQHFDIRTVPIRRIDHVALGYRDSRHALKPLVMPDFPSFKKEAEALEAGAAASSTSAPMGGSSLGPPSSAGPMATTSVGGIGTGQAPAGPQYEGAGPVAAVIDGNRKRYVEVTPQVRRMPVGITVVVDQAYIQDVLTAYANCPLRFQITQVHWQRFRGSLSGGPGGSAAPGGEEGVPVFATGNFGSGFNPGGMGGMPPSLGPVPGMGPMGFPTAPPSLGPTPGGMGPMGGPFGAFGTGGGSLTTISEGQLTAGLVELTIYGIVSLYEKYQAPDTTTAQ